MKVKDMTYGEINYWVKRIEELKTIGLTKQAWCDLGHELMQKHNLSERVAVRLLHGNIEEAIKLQEEEENQDCSGNSCTDDDGNIIFYDENVQKIYQYVKAEKYKASRDCYHEAESAFSMVINFIEEVLK